MSIVRFRLTGVRTGLLQGIVQAAGFRGFWPLRKPVLYWVGVNCDSIHIEGRKLVVLQSKQTIAVAHVRPGMQEGESRDALRWEQMLRPRGPHGR